MKRSTVAVGLVLGWLGTACGSNTLPGSCSLTLSGAITATTSCHAVAATTASTSGKVSFALEGAATGTTNVIAVSVLFPQTSLQTGTFGSSSGTSVTSAATRSRTVGIPSGRLSLLPGLLIHTRRTACGR